jgi:hypothetical protein
MPVPGEMRPGYFPLTGGKKTPRTDRCQANDLRKKIIRILSAAGNAASLNEDGRADGQALKRYSCTEP